ncbi:hypothetical protein Prudu_004994 [Prunus dulcis]|uniref:Acyl-CoA N-acyltransferases superfamily protein n=1 Tax=Prunus dulcis TaxID=3755 RepID=A0A4Y1QWN9_PRUDU|nr:hypothetical protein Prudu_004994 [Prunus dulcis]
MPSQIFLKIFESNFRIQLAPFKFAKYQILQRGMQLDGFFSVYQNLRHRNSEGFAGMAVAMSYCKPSPFLGNYPTHFHLGKSQSGKVVQAPRISALFWGAKKSAEPKEVEINLSLGEFTLTGVKPEKISLSVVSSISEVSSAEWDACALDATGPEKYNPFLTYAFLSSLEESASAVKETGWIPRHIIAKDESESILGVVPLYLKRDQVFDALVSALKDLTAKYRLSSLHITFPSENEWNKLSGKGFLQRIGMQYHWKNRNYKSFDEFLMDMKQSKRKNIRQERKKIVQQNLTMKRLRGDEIKARHWDSFYNFYRNTTDNKWGTPYLTRDFFHNMGSKMGDQVLLVVAEEGDELVAGALNLIGGDALFGRLWGCHPRAYYPSLHFEACYYQAIEAAIELNLNTVEAGAQGEHKIQRGYMPVRTYSCHYLMDEGFRKAIEGFLVRESTQFHLEIVYIITLT